MLILLRHLKIVTLDSDSVMRKIPRNKFFSSTSLVKNSVHSLNLVKEILTFLYLAEKIDIKKTVLNNEKF